MDAPSKSNTTDFENLDYTQIGAGVGVIGGVIWGTFHRYSFGKTALFAIVFGAAGAYLGLNIKKYLPDEK